MNVFIFQSVPTRFDLREKLRPGDKETWYATRYRNDMHPGDLVFFWMAGEEDIRGLYGWGHIVSTPYIKEEWDSHGVDISYEVKFEEPILASTLRDDPVLGQMLIFRAPQATNFLLTDAQVAQLEARIKSLGLPAPSAAGAGT